MEIKVIDLKSPEETNIILGQSHFIKTVEDIYEVLVSSVPGIIFWTRLLRILWAMSS